MDLSTTYLGMRLPHPLIVGAGPLGDDLDMVKALEDAGAALLVLRSLYEEEITGEQMDAFFNAESHSDSFAEASSFEPEPEMSLGPDEYLEHLRLIKSAVGIPVMASLNGVTPGGWISYARLLEEAGADGLELHLYHAASDMTMSAADVERQAIEIVREVKRSLRIPVAVKLAPLLTAFAHFAKQLDAAGADGLVLFTRFHRVDIDVEELEVVRTLPLSDSSELPLRLRGTAALAGRIKASHRDHRRRAHRARRHQGDDGRRARHADGLGAASARPGSPAHGPRRDRVVDAGARMELARRDARQHELRADSRSRRVRTRELPDGAEMTSGPRQDRRATRCARRGVRTWRRRATAARVAAMCLMAAALTARVTGEISPAAAARVAAGAQAAGSRHHAGYAGQRHVRGLSLRQGRHAQGHAARPGEESALAGGDAGLRELPRPGAGARGRRREREHPEVRADQARRDRTRRA